MTMETYGNHIWLVVEPPLWKMMEFVNWNKMTFPSEWNIKFHGSKPPTSIFIPWTHSSSFIHMETIFRMTMETIWKPYGNHMETIWKPYGNLSISIHWKIFSVLGHFEADGQGVHHLQAPAVGAFQPFLAVVADVHQGDAIFGDVQRPADE